MTETPTVADLLEQIQGYGAWAVIRRKAAPTAGLVGGTPHEVASLLDIPLETGIPERRAQCGPAGRGALPPGGRARASRPSTTVPR